MLSTHKLFAADFAFINSSGNYELDAQCAMMKELGYDAIRHSVWDCSASHVVRQLPEIQARHGLEIMGLYVILDLGLGPNHPRNTGTLAVLEDLEGPSSVTLPIRSPGATEAVTLKWLEQALSIAERRGIDLLLYPHPGFWMEDPGIAVDLCEKLKHPRLGIGYGSFPWYYTAGGGNPMPALKAVFPHLRLLDLSGSRQSPLGFNKVATIEPLDTGELDNLAFLGAAKCLGYRGPVGYLGYSEGGNPFIKLRRSLSAMREMIGVLDSHPDWVQHVTGRDCK